MNWLGFLGLINSIYGKGLPDIEKIQKLGLLAVKIGQVHALRIDFLSREKCEILAKLYRQNLTLEPADFLSLLETYSGRDFGSNFSSIDPKPLASASIGQIHRAKLKDGREVVIKAVKKNYKDSFKRDVENVEKLFKAVIFFYPKLKGVANPLGILEDIKTYTLSELDLTNEAKGHAELKNIYDKYKTSYDLSKLDFFHINEELSNENVLVSDYIEGRTFDELLENGELEYSRLLDLFLVHGTYMFVAGTFHGDIHPGNVILSNDKMYFVDTGSIGRVGDKIRLGLLSFFEALSYDDFGQCAKHLHSMSETELTASDYLKYEGKFLEIYRGFKGKNVAEASLTRKMMETIKLGVNYGMVFERGMFPIIRSLMYMDGMVLKCNPQAMLLKDMQKYIKLFRKN
ncbi:MAG: AarF/ABC1/UbiB kinase family protein [Endomicrobiales bacterium]|nr:AarF/ABC1/UbiB kinase family protein [Endomicrobiales bacterium]